MVWIHKRSESPRDRYSACIRSSCTDLMQEGSLIKAPVPGMTIQDGSHKSLRSSCRQWNRTSCFWRSTVWTISCMETSQRWTIVYSPLVSRVHWRGESLSWSIPVCFGQALGWLKQPRRFTLVFEVLMVALNCIIYWDLLPINQVWVAVAFVAYGASKPASLRFYFTSRAHRDPPSSAVYRLAYLITLKCVDREHWMIAVFGSSRSIFIIRMYTFIIPCAI